MDPVMIDEAAVMNREFWRYLTRLLEDLRYDAAYLLVGCIDADLETGRRHYRARDGRLLMDLGSVVDAILGDGLEGLTPALSQGEKES